MQEVSVVAQHYTNMKMDGEYVATAKSGRKTMQKMINMENIEKGNIMIAKFMGADGAPKYNPEVWDIYITGHLDVDGDHEEAQHFYTPSEMKYHTSWDWLMPVVQKCFDVTNASIFFFHDEDMEHIMHHLQVADKLNTYHGVVEFIRNYNNKK